MVTGRTTRQHTRVYMDGYDMSGYTTSIGDLAVEFDAPEAVALTDGIKGVLCGQPSIKVGTLNGIFDNTATSGLHVIAKGAGVARSLMIPIGIRAAPAMGDPVFACISQQKTYKSDIASGDAVAVSIEFDEFAADYLINYAKAWGNLLHAKGAETGANGANTNVDNGAATTAGGFFVYQLFSSDGTVTLSVDDSANGTSWLALSGATSGSIDASVTPAAGTIQLGITATVRRYLRWQLALGLGTTATFACAFVRG